MLRTPRPEPVPGRPPRWWRRLRRYRQLIAALLAALVVTGLATALRPPDAATTEVVVARRDLAPGTPLTDSDLERAPRPVAGLAVDAARDTADLVGRLVAAPVRGGEVVRDRDVVGRSLLASLGGGLVAVPVRLADDGAAALLRPGDVVDLVAADDGGASVAAAGVRVLAVPRAAEAASVIGAPVGGSTGSLVVVATTPADALALHRAAAQGRVGVVWRSASSG